MSESVDVLKECIDLQIAKGNDYQNPNSRVVQADYYPSGVKTISEIMQAKMLRIISVLETHESGHTENFESIEDSAKDLINYASFFVAYSRKGIPGQNTENDIFNNPPIEEVTFQKPSTSITGI
jgi:hypothetical protein